jgi:tetratricopeptide (TPR) repeat protein/tRNA A-37 threonylcarbamoyl transferase component Bud32
VKALEEHYEIHEQIGAGSFAAVFRATQKSTRQSVAVKILKEQTNLNLDPDTRLRHFTREIQLCAKLNHPNIVQLIDGGITQAGQVFSVFALVDGVALSDATRNGAMSVSDLIPLMLQVLEGIGYAHGMGVIHRDIKPSNIMICDAGTQKNAMVLDFGIGRWLENQTSSRANPSTLGDLLGTPAYAAPEQFNDGSVDERADLYSWGLTFFEGISGQPVFRGSFGEVLLQQLSPDEIELPPEIINSPVGTIIRDVVRKHPDDRPESAEEVLRELRPVAHRLQASTSVSNPPGTLGSRRVTVVCMRILPPSGKSAQTTSQLRQSIGAIVTRHGGVLAEFLGSRYVAFFGAPRTLERSSERAVLAAAEVVRFALEEEEMSFASAGISTGTIPARHADAHRELLGLTQVDVAIDLTTRAPVGEVWLCDRTRELIRDEIVVEPLQTSESPAPLFRLASLRSLKTPTVASSLTRMIGRDIEIARIENGWNAARRGDPSAFLVTGEAGIGKTRLVRQLCLGVEPQDYIEFRCFPELQHSPFHPVVNFLQDWIGDRAIDLAFEGLSLSSADLKFIAHLLGVGALPNVSDLSADRVRENTMRALQNALFARARQSPLLLIVEDVHWIDHSSQTLLQRLLIELAVSDRTTKMMLLLTSRTRDNPNWSTGELQRIELGRLSRGDSQQVVREITTTFEEIDQRLVHLLARRGDGVPLYLEELARMATSSVAGTTEGKGALAVRIPETLRDILAGRFDALRPRVQSTAQMAACIGRQFDVQILAALHEDPGRLSRELAALVRSGVVRERTKDGRAIYNFSHSLICDFAHDSMDDDTRKRVHRKIAEFLSDPKNKSVVGREPARLAQHFEHAADYENAFAQWQTAGYLASQGSAHYEAIEAFERALAILRGGHEVADRSQREIDIELALGNAYQLVYGYASKNARDAFERANQLSESAPGSRQLFNSLSGLWGYYAMCSDSERTEALVPRLKEIANATDSLSAKGVASCSEGITAFFRGDLRESLSILASATSLYNQAYAKRVQTYPNVSWTSPMLLSPTYYAWCLSLDCQFAEAVDQVDSAIEQARPIGAHAAVQAMTYAVAVGESMRDSERVWEYSNLVLDSSREHGFDQHEAAGRCARAWALAMRGDVDRALKEIHEGYQLFNAIGSSLCIVYRSVFFAEVLMAAEQFEEAISLVNTVLNEGRDKLEHVFDADMHRVKGDCLLLLGKKSEALNEFETAAALGAKNSARLFEIRALNRLVRLGSEDRHRVRLAELLSSVSGRVMTAELEDAHSLAAIP